MYPFYNPQFVKFEHEERMAQVHAATLSTRPSRRRAWLPERPFTAFGPFQRRPARSASVAR